MFLSYIENVYVYMHFLIGKSIPDGLLYVFVSKGVTEPWHNLMYVSRTLRILSPIISAKLGPEPSPRIALVLKPYK